MEYSIKTSQSPYKDHILLLDILQSYIEDGIAYASIIETEDVFHEDDNVIARAFTFSKGMREQIVVLNPYTHIYANLVMTEKPVSPRLIRDLTPILLDFIIDHPTIIEDE